MKTFAFKTLGCKVNQYESQTIRERLLGLGLKESPSVNEPEVCIVNTCSVTQKADRQSLEAIRKFSRIKSKPEIFVIGCSVQNSPQKISALTAVKAVVGNKDKENLPEIILNGKKALRSSRNIGITGFYKHTRAFVKIQDGCDYGCSYCIIPKLRGRSRSRPWAEIYDEVYKLVENGYKEIVLCGICLGAYGRDNAKKEGIIFLIEKLEKINGLFRIRLSSIEASDVKSGLISKIASSSKLCPHMHIPFQSGDDKILGLMNKRSGRAEYKDLACRLRGLIPRIALTTDIIAGFPGEGEKNFANTLGFLKEIRPSRIHIFPFSPRKGTAAFSFKETISKDALKQRIARLSITAKELSKQFYRENIKKSLSVLIESVSEGHTACGYSENYIKVYVKNPEVKPNTIISVTPVSLYKDGLLA